MCTDGAGAEESNAEFRAFFDGDTDRKRDRFLRPVSGKDVLSGGPGASISTAPGPLAGRDNVPGLPACCGPMRGGSVSRTEMAFCGDGLVLVFGDIGAGDRTGASRGSIEGRSIYILSFDW